MYSCGDVEPDPTRHVTIAGLDADVEVVSRDGLETKRVGFRGSDGLTHSFLVQVNQSSAVTHMDERMMQVRL